MNVSNETRTTHDSVTVNEIVQRYQRMSREEIANETPATITAELVILSSNLWTVGSMILDADRKVSAKWLLIRDALGDDGTDGKADREVKRTEEYADAQRARYAEKTCMELIRSLKKLLASKAIEANNAY